MVKVSVDVEYIVQILYMQSSFVTPLCYPAMLPRYVTPLCYPAILPRYVAPLCYPAMLQCTSISEEYDI